MEEHLNEEFHAIHPEAEYTAASEAARTVVLITQLAAEWCIPISNPSKLFVDNAAALAMAVANGSTTRSQHIDTKVPFVNDPVQRGVITPVHTPERQQIADMFT